MRSLILMAGLIGLSACSGNVAPGGNDTAAATPAPTRYAAGWDVSDACTILSKVDVAAVIGTFVEHTELAQVTKMTDRTAGFSTCVYTLPANKQVAFMARLSPEDDNTPAAMQRTRDETVAMIGPVEDVPDLGKSAFWSPKLRQVVVFIDGNRYMNLTLPRGEDDATAKKRAIALAKKVI